MQTLGFYLLGVFMGSTPYSSTCLMVRGSA